MTESVVKSNLWLYNWIKPKSYNLVLSFETQNSGGDIDLA